MGNNFARPKDDYENTEVYKSIKAWALSDKYRSDKYGFDKIDTYKNFFKKRACCTGNKDYNIPFPALVPNKDMDLIDRNNKYLTKQDNDTTTYSQIPIKINVFDSDIIDGDDRCKLGSNNKLSDKLNTVKASNSNTLCSDFYNKFADDVMEQNNMYGKKLYYGLYNSVSSSDNTNSYNKNYNIDLFCVNSQFKHDPELKKIPGLGGLDSEITAQAFDKLCSDNKTFTYKTTAEMPTINICSIATSISDSGRINAKNFNLAQSCNQNNNEKTPEHNPDNNPDDETDDEINNTDDETNNNTDNNSNNKSNKNNSNNKSNKNNSDNKTDNNIDDTDTDSNTFLDFVKNNYILIIILFIVFIFIISLFIYLYKRNNNSHRIRRKRNRNYE